jgi:predicted ABC-type ATPase
LSNRPRIYVLAGVNGGGKSSIGGAAFRESGADYYNPDEVARELMAARPDLSQTPDWAKPIVAAALQLMG